MAKLNIGTDVNIYPMPVALIGATVGGLVNFMTAAWITRMSVRPNIMAVVLSKNHFTTQGINENATFSINFPGADQVVQTDYCGLVSGRRVDKARLFDVFYGELGSAPMISQCPLCIECRLVDALTPASLPSDVIFLGEVVAAYSEERFLTNGRLDIRKMNCFVLTAPDHTYWTVGNSIGQAFAIGRTLMR